jgi:hypothetical protein
MMASARVPAALRLRPCLMGLVAETTTKPTTANTSRLVAA